MKTDAVLREPTGSVTLKRRIKHIVLRSRGDLRSISFGRSMRAQVPDDMAWNVCRELILCRIYEPDQIELSRDTSVVIDAGAHVGVFSLLASANAAKVVAIEPDPSNFRILERNVADNGLGDRVRTIHAGLWSRPGSFRYSPGPDSASGTISEPGTEDAGAVVPAVALDSILVEFESVDLLKLDIEGAEVGVLQSSSHLGRVRAIAAELHFPRDSDRATALRELLESEGFSVWIVPERRLYSLEMFRRAIAHRRMLRDQFLTKLLLIPYFLLSTIAFRTSRSGELPMLYAVRLPEGSLAPRDVTFSGVST